ncbi:MAG TPA: HK97-gp10 family putative phage morphogenesis protein [Burkholderiales bacterium]|nr:HK97-gp10 family putative phage morphogenesis protein [Burkholderiales bacterium]
MIEVQLEGIDRLQRRLDALPGKLQRRAMRRPLRATATKIARRLKPATPRRTGRAQRAVKVTVRSTARSAWAKVSYKGRPGFYLRIYEFGDRRQRPNPFFAQAIGEYIPEAKREFIDGLKAAVEREEDAPAEA